MCIYNNNIIQNNVVWYRGFHLSLLDSHSTSSHFSLMPAPHRLESLKSQVSNSHPLSLNFSTSAHSLVQVSLRVFDLYYESLSFVFVFLGVILLDYWFSRLCLLFTCLSFVLVGMWFLCLVFLGVFSLWVLGTSVITSHVYWRIQFQLKGCFFGTLQDLNVNYRTIKAHVCNGLFADKTWRSLSTGDVVKVYKNEYFSSNLLLKSSRYEDGVCYT